NLTGQAMQSRALTSTIRIKTLLVGSLGFQAMIEVGGTIPRQHLVRVRPPSAFALPELLGPSLLRSFPVFGSYLAWIDQHLRSGRRGCGQQGNHHKGKYRSQMSLH